MDGNDHESGSPLLESSNDNAGGWTKKRKFNTKNKHKAKEGTLEYSRKRARAIERLFQRNPDLPADVRNDMERELASHKATIADKAFQKRRSAMISKYHMVRFFERKKAMRHVKKLRSSIEKTSDPEDLQKLKHELHVAEVDEAYALNYPYAEPYISLYGKDKKEKDDGTPEAKSSGDAERPPMWATVEKAMEEGPEALKALRERRSPDESTASAQSKGAPNKSRVKKPTPLSQQLKPPVRPPPPPAVKAVGKDGKQQPPMNRRERRALMRKTAPLVQKDEDEDDGEGFFEEA